MTGLEQLEGTAREMIWGVVHLQGPYAGKRIGEIWFHAGDLLLKYITTAERLSVQVHPDDEYAREHEASRGGRGKTEIWHVMAAEPGARLALGLARPMSREEVRSAALDGSLTDCLNWIEAKAGDTVFVPAGTVHAIGAGLTICEVQQHCDITYRLFDYGRPRELHLDRGLDVIAQENGLLTGMAPGAGVVKLPFRGRYFHLQQDQAGPGYWMVFDGEGTIGGLHYGPRQVWKISAPVEWTPALETKSLLVNT